MPDYPVPKRIHQMEILAHIGGCLHAVADMPSLSRLLIELAIELVDAGGGTAGKLIDGRMVFREYRKNGAWAPIDYSFEPGQGVPGWVIENRKSYFTNDAEHDPLVDRQAWQSLEFYNLIDVPIIDRKGQLLGCFNIHNSVGRRPFDEQDVAVLEILAGHAALALENLQGLEEQRRSYQSERVLNKLLQLSMQELPLSDLLEKALDTILDTPWLPLERTGAIFLVEKDEPEVLNMKVQQGLSVTLQSTCASVPFGCCVCGAAATGRDGLFAEHGDARYDFCRDSMGEHTHYAIPIVKGDTVLGLFKLYLDKGHQSHACEMDFLDAVARILAGVIIRKRAEAEIRKLSQAIEQGDEGVLMTDTRSVIEYVNPAFCNITGYTPEEAIGKTPAMLKSTAQDPAFYKEMWQTISSGKIWHGTLIDRRKDGSYYPAQTTVAPVRSERGDITHYIGMQRDMTEQHRLEEQFRQAQKMEAIGTLVGGIAHDFNNMLSGMLGNRYLAKKKIRHAPEAVHKLDDAERLGYQAANMITQLLTFARKGRMEMVPFDFTSFVKESIKMARVSIPENIKLAEKIIALDMTIRGDATQLQQVMLNLLNNARDAVMNRPKPVISVRLDRFEADEGFISMHPDQESTHFARLSVSDNGYGISKEHLDKIFEPFFTTKPDGKGTGLGLAMSYGAIQTHKGIIDVESRPGEGATFHVYLPLSQAGEASQIEEKRDYSQRPQRNHSAG